MNQYEAVPRPTECSGMICRRVATLQVCVAAARDDACLAAHPTSAPAALLLDAPVLPTVRRELLKRSEADTNLWMVERLTRPP